MAKQQPDGSDTDPRSEFLDAIAGQNILGDLRLHRLRETGARLLAKTLRQPAAAAQEGVKLYFDLWSILLAQESEQPDMPADKRFADPAWSDTTLYRKWRRSYHAWSEALKNYADKAGLDPKEAGRARFLLGQISDAFAPTNFLFGNPAALKQAVETGGKSLVSGYLNWLHDVSTGEPVPSQVDNRPFKVGQNLAATPGHVVLRTEMFELLQYSPQTEQVYQRPVMMVPSIVNKYYAFDLAPGRSLLEYLVQSGLTVFTMVWRNPRPEHDDWGMDAYIESMDEARRAVIDIGGVADPHVIGICGAAPLLVTLVGHLTARKQTNFGSMALFVAPLDMTSLGEAPVIGDFLDSGFTKVMERLPKPSDRVTAREFSLLFAMLRPNDLIWNYWVNNYLMGNDPPVFDVLAWNADGAGITARFNREFTAFTQDNPLVTPGAVKFRDQPIADVAKLGIDSYVIGARTDHICPWLSVYRSAQMLGERCRFVLGGSGHIQTLVCPPDNPKAFYFRNGSCDRSAEDWLNGAERVQGSWWPDYVSWYQTRSGDKVAAPKAAGNKKYPPLGPAPGTYVLE